MNLICPQGSQASQTIISPVTSENVQKLSVRHLWDNAHTTAASVEWIPGSLNGWGWKGPLGVISSTVFISRTFFINLLTNHKAHYGFSHSKFIHSIPSLSPSQQCYPVSLNRSSATGSLLFWALFTLVGLWPFTSVSKLHIFESFCLHLKKE